MREKPASSGADPGPDRAGSKHRRREDEPDQQAAGRTQDRTDADVGDVVLLVDLPVRVAAHQHKTLDLDHFVFPQLLERVPVDLSRIWVGVRGDVESEWSVV